MIAARMSGENYIVGGFYGLSEAHDLRSDVILTGFVEDIRETKRMFNFSRMILATDWSTVLDSGDVNQILKVPWQQW